VVKAKQCRLDNAVASTSNASDVGSVMQTCDVCNISVPQIHIFAHMRTLAHRSKSCILESPGVERIDSAFKSRILSYRIHSEQEHADYTLFFDDIMQKVLCALDQIVHIHKSVKVNMVVISRYFLPSKEEFSDKSFNTVNLVVSIGCDLQDIYRSFVEAMKVQAADFQEKDSGLFKNI
jgi:hypothetical protein